MYDWEGIQYVIEKVKVKLEAEASWEPNAFS